MAEYLFSYGTLRESREQNELFGRRLVGNPDILNGFRRSEIEITDPGFLSGGGDKRQQTLVETSDPADIVEGTVFEVTYDELLQVDEYEPAEYRRAEVMLASGKEAWIYLVA
ncbi:MAG: gamma-glutamylcyclotransferase [Acidobacteria bacterium]|nr:gamma-glutamylcyclotransferase [Acidobacteriota bacterium]MBK7934293.1 gamma-glutamylcyclotransferase [Acidobacteriota bacterium]